MPKSIPLLNNLIRTYLNDCFQKFASAKTYAKPLLISACVTPACIASAQSIQTQDPKLILLAEDSPYGWVAREQLPVSMHSAIAPGCKGLYIETSSVKPSEANLDVDKLPLMMEAQNITVEESNRAILTGDVKVSQGDRSISANSMAYERTTDTATLENTVTIRQPGMLIHGQHAQVSTTQNKGTFDDATFVLQQQNMRGKAESVKQLSATKLELNEGLVTSCEPGDTTWVLEGEKITVDTATSQGVGRNVKLKIGSVPVFYLPYISFPVGKQRQTGFLFPSIGSSDEGVLDASFPYYWNLAPNYDATLTPRFISGRGTMLEFETRHLNKWMRTELGMTFLPDDEGSQDRDLQRLIDLGEISEEAARPHAGNNRWLAQVIQNGGSTKGWYSRANYTRVSDGDYFRDIGASSLAISSETFLDQSFEVGYQLDHWKISSLAFSQQVLLLDIDSPYRKLPQIDIDGRYNFGNWMLAINNRFTQFKHRDSRPDILTGKRFNTDYQLRWEKRSPWGFIAPEVGFKSLHYALDNNDFFDLDQTQFGLGAPQASIDLGLIFEHQPGAYIQTLEPRIFYLYRKEKDHSKLFGLGPQGNQNINFDTSGRTFTYGQLYRDSRFIGGDRLDDANQVTIGLTTRWQSNRTGEELFNVSVGQIVHFDDRQVTLGGSLSNEDTEDSSEFASEAIVNLSSRTQMYINSVYDTESQRINRGSAGVHYASQDYQRLFNISYSFLRDQTVQGAGPDTRRDIDQVDLSFTYPVATQWSLMGRANYDFENQQELESFVGFEYNDCCYRLRFLARRWLDSNIANLVDDEDALYDQGIFFEIQFKGLGSQSKKVSSILNDAIFGYETREERLH